MTVFTLGICMYACVRESMRTQDMGQGESHSHPLHVDI